jgi:hypothetical protein
MTPNLTAAVCGHVAGSLTSTAAARLPQAGLCHSPASSFCMTAVAASTHCAAFFTTTTSTLPLSAAARHRLLPMVLVPVSIRDVSAPAFNPYAFQSYWEEAALEFEYCKNKEREELSEGVGKGEDGMALYCTPPSPQYESFSTLNVPLNSCSYNIIPLLPHNSAYSVSNPSHHGLHIHVYTAPHIEYPHNSEQNSIKLPLMKFYSIIKVCSVETLDLLYRCNDCVGKFLRLLCQAVPSDAIIALNTLYNSCHRDSTIECMMDVIEKHIQNESLYAYNHHIYMANEPAQMDTGVQEPPFPVTVHSSQNLVLDGVSRLSVLDVNYLKVPLKDPNASNVGLQNSQDLMHNSEVDIVLSGGGFVTKNSENSESNNLEKSTKNSLIDSSVQIIPKYHQTSFLSDRLPSNCSDPLNRAHVSFALIPPLLDSFSPLLLGCSNNP